MTAQTTANRDVVVMDECARSGCQVPPLNLLDSIHDTNNAIYDGLDGQVLTMCTVKDGRESFMFRGEGMIDRPSGADDQSTSSCAYTLEVFCLAP
jgi:hypothetical protein